MKTESDPALIDRRSFIGQGALAVVGLACAACAGDATGSQTVNGSITVGSYPALANVGGIALVTVSGAPLAVVRTGTTTFLALSRICPHQGATVNNNGSGFTCPQHGAQFNTSGTWIGGQRTSNMQSLSAQYDAGTDTLTITG